MTSVEWQTVTAYIHYPLNSARVIITGPGTDYQNGSFDTGPWNWSSSVPPYCYLKRTEDWTLPDGTKIRHQVSSYNQFTGDVSVGDSFDNYTYSSHAVYFQAPQRANQISDAEVVVSCTGGGTIRYLLENKYDYETAVADANKLLEAVDLLNPLKTYLALSYVMLDSWETELRPVHFCYPSEAAGFGYPNQYSTPPSIGYFPAGAWARDLWVSGDENGNPVFSVVSPQVYGGSLAGYSTFKNDWATNGIPIYNYYNETLPWIIVGKSAYWTPYDFNSKLYSLLDPTSRKFASLQITGPIGGPYSAAAGCVLEPLNPPLKAGENIFLPSDVPGYGSAQWMQQLAAGLPTAKTTADSTNVTADNATHTVDEY